MDQKCLLLCTTRWGTRAAAVATAAVMCLPAIPAHAVVDDGASARSEAMVATAGGFSGGNWGDRTADRVSKDAHGTYEAEKDPGSLYVVDKAIGARSLWAKKDGSGRALTGQGVSVAVLDSGVNEVAGLDGAGKVTYGPDLSIEANGLLTQQDTFGHGHETADESQHFHLLGGELWNERGHERSIPDGCLASSLEALAALCKYPVVPPAGAGYIDALAPV